MLPRSPVVLQPCDAIFSQLSEFVDDELDRDARHRIAVHLATCGGCAQLAAELTATVQALHALRARRFAVRTGYPS
jgi:anti-sigma factor RsiW